MKKKGIDKNKKILDRNTLHSHNNPPIITENQKLVLYLFMEEHLSEAQIGRRLKKTRQAINQTIKSLRKKGLLDSKNYNTLQKGGVVTIKKSVSTAKWRFHKLHFVIRPFYFEPRYHKWRLKRGNIFYSGDWRFVLHEDIIEMQIKEFVDFSSINKWEAMDKAHRSFNKQLSVESNRYGFHVFKDGKANIRICDQHLEDSNSGVAKGRNNQDYVEIKGYHDNKVYFTFDKSKGTINKEYIHSDLAISDSEKFEPFFNSIRYHDIYLPHEVKNIIDSILNVQLVYADQIKKHLKVQDETLKLFSDMSKTLKKIEEGLTNGRRKS